MNLQENAQANRMKEDVRFLTEIRPFRNYENIESLEKVVSYIKEQLSNINVGHAEQKWLAEENEYKNILCSYQPQKQKRLIMGAHYDVCGDTPGADDNGSAVSGLLETIRLVFESKPELDYGIDFVFYCLEEPPFFGTKQMGSYVHAKSVSKNKDNIIGMICYEMIGYFSDEKNSQDFPMPGLNLIYPSRGNFIMTVGIPEYESFNKKVFKGMKKKSKVPVYNFSHRLGRSLASMSDQRNYWKFDIPALMINDTSFMRNDNYHKLSDDMETLDYDKMSEVINSMMRCLISLN
mgnify:FL=1